MRISARPETEWGKPLMNSPFTLGLMIGISVNDTTVGTTIGNLGMTDVTTSRTPSSRATQSTATPRSSPSARSTPAARCRHRRVPAPRLQAGRHAGGAMSPTGLQAQASGPRDGRGLSDRSITPPSRPSRHLRFRCSRYSGTPAPVLDSHASQLALGDAYERSLTQHPLLYSSFPCDSPEEPARGTRERRRRADPRPVEDPGRARPEAAGPRDQPSTSSRPRASRRSGRLLIVRINRAQAHRHERCPLDASTPCATGCDHAAEIGRAATDRLHLARQDRGV